MAPDTSHSDSDRLLDVLYAWTVFTALWPTLVVYRATLQHDYEWGLFGLVGTGRSGGYWFVLAASIWVWSIVRLASRPPRRPFGALLVGWNGLLFGSLIAVLLRSPDGIQLRGDAWSLRIEMSLLGPAISAAFLALSVIWWWKNRGIPRPRLAGRTRAARLALAIALLLVPVIAALFGSGEGSAHTVWDRLAVAAVIAQTIALGIGLPLDRAPKTKRLPGRPGSPVLSRSN